MTSEAPPLYADQLAACSRCGLCLDVCPTFALSRDEKESPRGRVQLMLMEATGVLSADQTSRHLTNCLQCRQCEPVCPTGVRVTDAINEHLELGPAGRFRTACLARVRFAVGRAAAQIQGGERAA